MKIDVFDTYAHTDAGKVLHFDVLMPNGSTQESAIAHANSFLASIGVTQAKIKSLRCNFCHSEPANDTMKQSIDTHGYFILQMEGCPNPYRG
jgi:hypothetical protein